PASRQGARDGRADGSPRRVERREPAAAGGAVVRAGTQERRSSGHVAQAWEHVPDEMSGIGPRRAAVRTTQRDEMAHTTGAVQLLNVVPSDQSALRVADEIDTL